MSGLEERADSRQPEPIQETTDRQSPETDSALPRLDALVDQFVCEIERRFLRRLRSRPRVLKRRVLHLIRVRLPPRPRRAGRPPRIHITRALQMYRQQKRDVQ